MQTTEAMREKWQELERKWVELREKMPEGDAAVLVRLRQEFGYSGVEK